ncbi:MAG: hypothetical protein SW833_01885 [Cyanobacteriota bacterium]|nr:hypothetical protein [Cyanobacteriota bacterium]
MFSQFRTHYPQGSLASELVAVELGQFVVRAIASVEGAMLATSLASAHTIEQAEDRARGRLLELLELEKSPSLPTVEETTVPLSPSSSVPFSLSTASSPAQTPPVNSSPVNSSAREESHVSPSSNNTAAAVETHELPSAADVSPEIAPPTQPSEPVSPPAPSEKVAEKSPASGKAKKSSKKSSKKAPVEVEAIASESVAPSLEEEENFAPVVPQTEPQPQTQPEPEPEPEPAAIASSVSEPPAEKIAPLVPQTQTQTEPELPKESVVSKKVDESLPIDFSDIIAQTNLEIKRLGWTNDQGRQYLLATYGKRSRQLLSDEELVEFLEYLQGQPTPE